MPESSLEMTAASTSELSDDAVVARVLSGEAALFEVIMRRYNQRLFRVARGITGNDHDAEDVLQEAYLGAFGHLGQFAGRARFSTWLTRIAVYAALAKRKRQCRLELLDPCSSGGESLPDRPPPPMPDQQASNDELAHVLRQAIDDLPGELRIVFVMRMIEGIDTRESAACLGISEANIKVRLHRARAWLRQRIDAELGEETRRLFEFGNLRCDRIVQRVLVIIANQANREQCG